MKNCLRVEDEKKFTINNKEWITFTHKNDYEMENILSHDSIYFLNFLHKLSVFFHCSYCYQTKHIL